MKEPLDSRSAWQFGLATVCVTAALFFFGNGLAPVWWLTWLAPLPALVLAPRVSKLAAFAVAFAGGSPGRIHLVDLSPWHCETALGSLRSLRIGTRNFLRTWRAAHAHVPAPWLALACSFAFPAVWTSYEYLNALASPHSTYGSLAYTQMNFPSHNPGRFDRRSLGNRLFAFSVSLEHRSLADVLAAR